MEVIKNNDQLFYQILVIGGGHAGIEASLICSKLNHSVALVTLDKKKIGFMPCNPSVGGAAKGIIVREIDALGGQMAKTSDLTALQFKLLNTSGGPAVQALRVQSDKVAYSRYMSEFVSSRENLTLIEGIVEEIIIEDKKAKGVKLKNGTIIKSEILILTTGTYLTPITYKGKEQKEEGPDGEKKIFNGISEQLRNNGFRIKRFKTGTSPRIFTNSINFTHLKKEKGSEIKLRFSNSSKYDDLLPFSKQLDCYLIHTNKKTHEIIKENSHLSPIFYKENLGAGPRYCPSIEHKVCLFPKNENHQIFIEPESLELETSYLQGLSTSLPIEIQADVLKTLPGLENCKVEKWGYAIEYDVIDSNQLKNTLESKIIENLFLSGQINGTTGYEEAAAQGLIAGINASRKFFNLKPLVLGRNEAYIGVLIDDLVTKEINDPYRMLTSRAEYRLLLRHDNVYTRLTQIAKEMNLVDEQTWEKFNFKKNLQKEILEELRFLKFEVNEKLKKTFKKIEIIDWKKRKSINGKEILKQKGVSLEDFFYFIPKIKELEREERSEIEINVKYEGYIKRQEKEVSELIKSEKIKIPSGLDYKEVPNLAEEAKEKLAKIKPDNFGQAQRIAGVNPSDIQMLFYYLKRKNKNER